MTNQNKKDDTPITVTRKALRITGEKSEKVDETLVREVQITVKLNGRKFASFMASPKDLEPLAAGFLLCEGVISRADKISGITVEKDGWAVDVSVPGAPAPGALSTDRAGMPDMSAIAPVTAGVRFTGAAVDRCMREMENASDAFRKTGGVHAAALADGNGIKYFAEDVSRHNAVDRVIGRAFLEGAEMGVLMLLCTCRVSIAILARAARCAIPVVISRSAPTDLAVQEADRLGVTLAGFARKGRMNVYSGEHRLT